MMSEYYKKSLEFQKALKEYAEAIFSTYGKKLVLRLEEYNLLQNKKNCIESSTAIGFVLEEFLVSKLEMYSHSHSSCKYKIERYSTGTTSECYDCYSFSEDIKFLVNIKAEKQGSNCKNEAVAAITHLHEGYVKENPAQKKNYVIFKIKYSIKNAEEDTDYNIAKPRCLQIENFDVYCIEQVNFLDGYRSDNRSWSPKEPGKSMKNNGRLMIGKKELEGQKVDDEKISYYYTSYMLDNIYCRNMDYKDVLKKAAKVAKEAAKKARTESAKGGTKKKSKKSLKA